MIITLTGFMGCGKSSVGRCLSELLCCPFMDLDAVIEESQGRSIPDIFAAEGEAAFRQMEVEALSRIIEAQQLRGNVVVALGGGAVMTPECAELVRKKTHCIYLRASVDTLVSHLENEAAGRPMLQGASLRSRIEELMALRSSTYEATAHDVIDTDGKTVEEVAAEIKF
jgi:shikimate kinase